MYKSEFDSPSTHRAQPLGCANLLPCLWSEDLAFRDGLQRNEVVVGRVLIHGITPPLQLVTATRVDDGKEDDDSPHGETEVESE